MGRQTPDQQKKNIKDLQDATEHLQQKMKNVGEEGSKSFKKIEDQTKNLNSKMMESGQVLDDLEERLSELPDKLSFSGRIIKENMVGTSEELTRIVESTNAINNALVGGIDQLENMVDIAAKPFESLVGFIERVPFGDKLLQSMNIDKITENLRLGIGVALEKSVVEGSIQFKDLAMAFGGSVKQVVSSFIAAGGVLFLLAGLVALTVKRFVQMDSTMADIRDKTGLQREDTMAIAENVRFANRNLAEFGITMEMANETALGMLDTFGSLGFVSQKNIQFVSLLGKRLGIGGGEAAKMYQTFLNMVGGSEDIAQNVSKMTIGLAEAVGVAPQAVFQDIANASDKIFEVTDGLPETIAATAVEARRLGLSLDAVLGISENLLNFESSIEAQMNAMVLTGRNLNLEQARFYAAVGETDKVLQEVSKQFGDINEFSRLLPFQQKALAESIGLSAGQLRNMLRTQKQLQEVASGTKSVFDALQEGASFEDILQTTEMLTPLEELKNSFLALVVSLSDVLMPIIKALIPIFKVLAVVLTFVADILNVTLTPLIEGLVGAGQAIYEVFYPAIEALYDLFRKVFSGESVLVAYNEFIDTIKGFAGKIFDAFVKPFVDAWEYLFGNTIWSAENIAGVFNDILDVLRTVGNAIIDILILPFEIVWERVKSIFEGIGDLIIDTIGVIGDLIGGGGGAPAPAVAGAGIPAVATAAVAAGAAPPAVRTATGEEITLQDVVDKLDALINVFSNGVNLKFQGAKIGEILAKDARK